MSAETKEYSWKYLTPPPRPLAVGDTVIKYYSRRHNDSSFSRVRVVKTTRANWFYVEGDKQLFRPDGSPKEKSYSSVEIVADTPENLKQLEWREARDKEVKAELKAADDKRQAEYKARLKQELKEVKAAVGEDGLNILQHFTAPDGNQLFTIRLPVKPEHERKAGWEVITVRVGPPRKDLWDKHETREYAMTVANGSTSSFGSYSTSRTTDSPTAVEDALWDCARQAYHSW